MQNLSRNVVFVTEAVGTSLSAERVAAIKAADMVLRAYNGRLLSFVYNGTIETGDWYTASYSNELFLRFNITAAGVVGSTITSVITAGLMRDGVITKRAFSNEVQAILDSVPTVYTLEKAFDTDITEAFTAEEFKETYGIDAAALSGLRIGDTLRDIEYCYGVTAISINSNNVTITLDGASEDPMVSKIQIWYEIDTNMVTLVSVSDQIPNVVIGNEIRNRYLASSLSSFAPLVFTQGSGTPATKPYIQAWFEFYKTATQLQDGDAEIRLRVKPAGSTSITNVSYGTVVLTTARGKTLASKAKISTALIESDGAMTAAQFNTKYGVTLANFVTYSEVGVSDAKNPIQTYKRMYRSLIDSNIVCVYLYANATGGFAYLKVTCDQALTTVTIEDVEM